MAASVHSVALSQIICVSNVVGKFCGTRHHQDASVPELPGVRPLAYFGWMSGQAGTVMPVPTVVLPRS